jgi:hypothetical protein
MEVDVSMDMDGGDGDRKDSADEEGACGLGRSFPSCLLSLTSR